ncbi:OLC1v1024238C1 [Oldenlandia corymbosa var. corymbosa]|uniref:OLC1v1024238C1 n=1 Tax=Oldenlandia corymbosa var. corymbosa TaxID=529605 RepID=A0AAV1C2C7_OLDCO|nr:OLC1v1024238C1 [Oldenlandia corymbosa var. corymbosa]
MAIVDSGSDLTWTQFEPCAQSYKQDTLLFNPAKSSSYRKLRCNTTLCSEAREWNCDKEHSCTYKYSYVDGSFTVGNLANETFTFGTNSGKKTSIPTLLFDAGVSITQWGIESGVGSANNATKKTKIINVNKISSNGDTAAAAGPKKGVNIIIDSGVKLTFLPRQLATDLEATLCESIIGTISPDPQGLFNLCYKTGKGTTFPDIVAHFTGAYIILPTFNTFLQVSDDLICFTLLGTDDLPIFGNLSQGDYLIGYNLVNGTVYFKQIGCSKVI